MPDVLPSDAHVLSFEEDQVTLTAGGTARVVVLFTCLGGRRRRREERWRRRREEKEKEEEEEGGGGGGGGGGRRGGEWEKGEGGGGWKGCNSLVCGVVIKLAEVHKPTSRTLPVIYLLQTSHVAPYNLW